MKIPFRWEQGLLLGLLIPVVTHAVTEHSDAHSSALVFLGIGILLLAAKLSSLIERLGQPAVLGELVIGVILGNAAFVGIHLFDGLASDTILRFLAELGAVILLFQTGLESNIKQMRTTGFRALLVAIVGVVVPFVLGTYIVGPKFFPNLAPESYLFLGAALTATSVGITARVFRDLKQLHRPEAQIVLGAAVIDDVLGLMILAVVSAIVTVGSVSVGTVAIIIAKALFFLGGAIILGQLLAPLLGRSLSRIHPGVGMKFTLAMSFGLLLAWLAQEIGLAPIVGAFAAGLVLDPVHFRSFQRPRVVEDIEAVVAEGPEPLRMKVGKIIEQHAHKHVEDLIEPIGHFVVPLFFVMTGMQVKLGTLFQPSILLLALGITAAALFGKIVAGAVAGPVRKWIVGWGMVPRGEVGLIFAALGKGLGVLSDELFSVIVVMVIFSTLVTPPILAWLLRRSNTTVAT